jgi:DNA polymerase-3 subunit gamma/tau
LAPPELEVRLLQPLDADFTRQVAAALKDATGEHWIVNSSTMSGEPSLREQQLASAEARREEIRATPIVAAALAAFPGAALAEPDRSN